MKIKGTALEYKYNQDCEKRMFTSLTGGESNDLFVIEDGKKTHTDMQTCERTSVMGSHFPNLL